MINITLHKIVKIGQTLKAIYQEQNKSVRIAEIRVNKENRQFIRLNNNRNVYLKEMK